MATILAGASVADKAGEIIVSGLVLMAFFLALGVGLWYYRRWRGESQTPSTAPWTFDDLRKLRDQGSLSEGEYQTLRSSMIGLYTKEAGANSTPAISQPKKKEAENESWDWVAEDERGSGDSDVNK